VLGRGVQQRQNHGSVVVLPVRINDHDPLPGTQHDIAAVNREDEGRVDERRKQMIGAVAPGAVAMRVAIVFRQEPLQRLLQVQLGAGTRLHQRQPRSGMREEDVEEPVAPDLCGEAPNAVRHIKDEPTLGVHREPIGAHAYPKTDPFGTGRSGTTRTTVSSAA
jgi:hypothetical protein